MSAVSQPLDVTQFSNIRSFVEGNWMPLMPNDHRILEGFSLTFYAQDFEKIQAELMRALPRLRSTTNLRPARPADQ